LSQQLDVQREREVEFINDSSTPIGGQRGRYCLRDGLAYWLHGYRQLYYLSSMGVRSNASISSGISDFQPLGSANLYEMNLHFDGYTSHDNTNSDRLIYSSYWYYLYFLFNKLFFLKWLKDKNKVWSNNCLFIFELKQNLYKDDIFPKINLSILSNYRVYSFKGAGGLQFQSVVSCALLRAISERMNKAKTFI